MSEVIYGIKSISVGDLPHEHKRIDLIEDEPFITFPESGVISGTIELTDINSKSMRLFFGNNWNKPPKQIVCKFKLKSTKFARPVYQVFVFPKYTVASFKQLRSITTFIKGLYS